MGRPAPRDTAFIKKIRVDPEDAWLLEKYNWRRFTTKTSGPYAVACMKINGSWTQMLLHRLITNAPPRTPVEHLNDDGLDNRRVNLLVSNQRSNNLRAHPVGGVHKRGRLWRVQMGNRDRGGFATKEAAVKHRAKLRGSKLCRA